ncbi:MAG: thrombospondin type 3 repeat-containing protein [Patescibacteria group bacterium]
MKHLGLSFIIILFPVFVSAQSNAGFVQGLWYEQETLFVGESTRIYAAIRNNTGADLTGTVEFYVNDNRIERNDVSALNNRLVESWTDWTPTYGTSTIRATLSRTELSSTASGTQQISVVSALTEDIVFVDYDTDGDGRGNATDRDDDGDGWSDEDEIANGTDPLVYDEKTDSGDVEDEQIEEGTEMAVEDDNSNSGPEGLEQFLTDSRADTTFETVTDLITTTRTNLDNYRERRNAERAIESRSDESGVASTSAETAGEADSSFGAISRTQGDVPKTFTERTWDFIVRNLENLYTLMLWLTSLFLWNPIIVQLTLLFLILYTVYRLARKFGRRDN